MKKLGPKADPRKGGGSKEGAKIAWGESNHRTKGKKKKQHKTKQQRGGEGKREVVFLKNEPRKGRNSGWWVSQF